MSLCFWYAFISFFSNAFPWRENLLCVLKPWSKGSIQNYMLLFSPCSCSSSSPSLGCWNLATKTHTDKLYLSGIHCTAAAWVICARLNSTLPSLCGVEMPDSRLNWAPVCESQNTRCWSKRFLLSTQRQVSLDYGQVMSEWEDWVDSACL